MVRGTAASAGFGAFHHHIRIKNCFLCMLFFFPSYFVLIKNVLIILLYFPKIRNKNIISFFFSKKINSVRTIFRKIIFKASRIVVNCFCMPFLIHCMVVYVSVVSNPAQPSSQRVYKYYVVPLYLKIICIQI